jgi:hypothetical protein
MSRLDYIPKGYPELRVWGNNFVGYLKLTPVMVRLKLDPTELEALEDEVKAYDASCAVADGANAGPVDKTDRKTKAKHLRKTIREYVNSNLLYHKALTDDDRKALGLTIPDTTPTPETNPKEKPELEPNTKTLRQITCKILNEKQEAAKPPHVHGTEIVYGFIPEGETATLKHLTQVTFTTKSSITLVFDDEYRGRKVGLCGRYENHRGGKGPWGPIIEGFIP